MPIISFFMRSFSLSVRSREKTGKFLPKIPSPHFYHSDDGTPCNRNSLKDKRHNEHFIGFISGQAQFDLN